MTKKKAKDRKISQENKDWYRLGYLNGENRLQQTINKLRAAYGHLFDELLRLDRDEPEVGVLLDYKTVKQLIKNARKGTQNQELSRKLQRKYNKARRKDNQKVISHIAELREELIK